MVYKENFVAVLKCNGKILREKDGYVNIPFGSEYSILLKNLDSRKAVVDISVDGEDVLDGDRLIINPNSDLELEGFKKGNRTTNRFKFIQKTEEIVEHRGDKVDDGIVRIEFTFEKKVQEMKQIQWTYNYNYPNWNDYYYHQPIWCYKSTFTSNNGGGLSSSNSVRCCFSESFDSFSPEDDEGITVKGSDDTDQKFVIGHTKELESQSQVINIRMRGYNSKSEKVKEPLTVDKKLRCPTCGRISKSSAKFCSNCGTFLE